MCPGQDSNADALGQHARRYNWAGLVNLLTYQLFNLSLRPY
jgi:hypothetical protein